MAQGLLHTTRICVFTDEPLTPPYDEGVRNLAFQIYSALHGRPNTLLICTRGQGELALEVKTNKLLLSAELRRAIRAFTPDVILYLSDGGVTAASLVRARVLKSHGRGCPIAFLSVQPKLMSTLGKIIRKLFSPDLMLTQSIAEARKAESQGCRASMVPVGVDLAKFVPVDASRKLELRLKHGVGASDTIVLHVGHLREDRNIRVLKRMQEAGGCRCIMVGSTRTIRDGRLVAELVDAGVMVIEDYQPNIEEWYQLADLYVFPVMVPDAAIQFPLSVLEALACNLPVVTTRFGGLVDALPEAEGLKFVDSDDALVSAVQAFSTGSGHEVREIAEGFSWQRAVDLIVKELEAVAARKS